MTNNRTQATARAPNTPSPELLKVNRDMESKWRAGEITFSQFNWHLMNICGM